MQKVSRNGFSKCLCWLDETTTVWKCFSRSSWITGASFITSGRFPKRTRTFLRESTSLLVLLPVFEVILPNIRINSSAFPDKENYRINIHLNDDLLLSAR